MKYRNEVQQQDCEAMEKVITEKEHFFPWKHEGDCDIHTFTFEDEKMGLAGDMTITPGGAYQIFCYNLGRRIMVKVPGEEYSQIGHDAAATLEAAETALIKAYQNREKNKRRREAAEEKKMQRQAERIQELIREGERKAGV